jgi:GNAT superfamily N-acetyltransferase
MLTAPALPACPLPGLRAVELIAGMEPLLQRFFDDNPLYFVAVSGKPAAPGEAHDEMHGELPAGWSHGRQWVIGYVDATGALAAMANVVSDLLVPTVWHIGTFIVATVRHGSGDAQALFAALQDWARSRGACWLRLGVVRGNVRAERFWARQGFVQTRLRNAVVFGEHATTVRVMCKPLAGGSIEAYLGLVRRDRPQAAGD